MISHLLEQLGLRSFFAGKYERAARLLESVKKRSPDRSGINQSLGMVRLAQRRFDDAQQLFLEELDRHGESYSRLRAAGDLYYLWGKRNEASSYYEKAYACCEREADRTLLEQRIHNCSDEVSFERVMESQRLFNQGNEAMKENDHVTARERFQKAIDCDTTNYQALNNLGAVWMNYEKQPETAVQYFERAAELSNLGSVGANLKKARRRAGLE